MKDFKVTPLKGQPGVIDEITADDIESIHIEREDKHRYWMRVGDKDFYFQTAAFHGPGILLVEATNESFRKGGRR